MRKINLKKCFISIFVFLLIIIVGIIINKCQKERQIPIDVSYKRFQNYEKELKIFSETNDFEFSSHGDCDSESCYKTIILDSDKDFSIAFDFNNYGYIEQSEISISSNKDNTDIFSLLDYEIIDKIFIIVFNKSYKEELIQKSNSISKVNKNSEGKIFKLDRKNNITIQYFTDYYYESKGVKSDSYYSRIIISKN